MGRPPMPEWVLMWPKAPGWREDGQLEAALENVLTTPFPEWLLSLVPVRMGALS